MKWWAGSCFLLAAAAWLLPQSVSGAAPAQMSVTPPVVSMGDVFPGDSQALSLIIQETGGSEPLTGVSLSTSEGWISLVPTSIGKIEAKQSRQVTVKVSAPSGAAYGSYNHRITVSAQGLQSVSIPVVFRVPAILQASPGQLEVAIAADQQTKFKVEIINICPTARVYDMKLSADDNIGKWLVVPSGTESLGPSGTRSISIEARAPQGELKPVGYYSGLITTTYRNGPPSGISSAVTLKVTPPETWFSDTTLKVDRMPATARVYLAVEPYRTDVDVSSIKQALVKVTGLVKDDPFGFYDSVEPFLVEGIQLLSKLTSDIPTAFEAYVGGTSPLTRVTEVIQQARAGCSKLQSALAAEGRDTYRSQMEVVQTLVEDIMGDWEKKVGAEAQTTEQQARTAEQQAEGDLRKAEASEKLYPARNYYETAKTGFANASKLYAEIGLVAESRRCKDRADQCDGQVKSKEAEIAKVAGLAKSEAQAGDEEFDKAARAQALSDAVQLFASAATHFNAATLQYRKLGTSDYDALANQNDDKGRLSDQRRLSADSDARSLESDALARLAKADEVYGWGATSILPTSALGHYSNAQQLYLESRDLYTKLGGENGTSQVRRISGQLGVLDGAVRGERVKLTVYVLIIVAVIVLAGLRYLQIALVRRAAGREKRLFQRH